MVQISILMRQGSKFASLFAKSFHFERQYSSKTGSGFSPKTENLANPIVKKTDLSDYLDVLHTHFIPGKYIHFIKKPIRILKKEARLAKKQSTKIIGARSLGYEPNLPSASLKNQNKDEKETENKQNAIITRRQEIITQRVSRALRKCFDILPSPLLGPSYMKITNITASVDLRSAQIYWRPIPDRNVREADIEQTMRVYQSQLREIIKKRMYVKRPPRIVFMRQDLATGNIEDILRKLMLDEEKNKKDQSDINP
ncbi:hypothetical protein G9A89_008162 [Geosiphon pyriformis]|nr:hypothetical protein G9A89_008162 [Geosiphon pyriformis]